MKSGLAAHEREQIICHYARVDRLKLYTGQARITAAAGRSIQKAFGKRKNGIPLGHVLGVAPFYGRDFVVTPDTLIPRPETERLVEEALGVLKTHFSGKPAQILDLGTGSGCIAVSLTLEWPACKMTALDASAKALKVARKNFKFFGLGQKIRSVESRFFKHFEGKKALWDLVVSNPPYIPAGLWTRLSREVKKEPKLALDGGPKGLDALDVILEEAPRYLKPGGWLLLEIGKGQSGLIAKKWAGHRSYASLAFEKDLNGIDRILIARVHG